MDSKGQALVVDGVAVDADGVRRLCREIQQLKIALMLEVFAHNRTRQAVRRLEYELRDCGEMHAYSITPRGYDLMREWGM